MINDYREEDDRPPPRRSRYGTKPNSLETRGNFVRPGGHGHGCDSFVVESTPPEIGALGKMATGFKKLVLVPALTKQGLSVLKAWAVIDTVFDSIKDALGRHEDVELPIGTFTVLQNPYERRAWKFGQITVLYAHKYKVKFLPSAELNLAAAAAPPSPPRHTRKKKIVKSELTTSVELIQTSFARMSTTRRTYSSPNFATAPPFPQCSRTFSRSPTSSVRSTSC